MCSPLSGRYGVIEMIAIVVVIIIIIMLTPGADDRHHQDRGRAATVARAVWPDENHPGQGSDPPHPASRGRQAVSPQDRHRHAGAGLALAPHQPHSLIVLWALGAPWVIAVPLGGGNGGITFSVTLKNTLINVELFQPLSEPHFSGRWNTKCWIIPT